MADSSARQDLIVQASRGDRVALGQLLLAQYTRLSGHISARLTGRLARFLSVEDVLQETFVQATRDIGKCEARTEESFAAWLNAIADHRLADIARTLGRQKRGGDRVQARGGEADSYGSMAELVEMISGRGRTPSRSAAMREAVQAIQVGIAGLPDDQREAVRLHHLDGKSIDETAEAMGRTPGAVRGLLQRARQALRDALVRSTAWLSGR